MKRILTAISILVVLGQTHAAERLIVTDDQLATFFKSTTYVVTTNDNIIFDAFLNDAVKRLWTVTPHKIVGLAEFDALRTDESCSFLMVTKVVESKDKLKRPYLYLSLLMGSKDAESSLDLMAEVASIPLACESVEGDIPALMLNPMVAFVQKHAENLKDKSFKDRVVASFQQRLQAYNYNMSQLKGKIIYVCKSDVDIKVNIREMEAKYGNLFRFVEKDDIARVVSEKEANAAVAFTVYPQGDEKGAYGYKMIMDVDGSLYYYYYESKPKNFLLQKNDFDMIINSSSSAK
ncbi:MAG: hypothetical protein LBJ57_05720 [Prevotellaceae bacterium]|jgi:hypothetical protein|nr:hypothetical protein [Prevotellaceae bacterium]